MICPDCGRSRRAEERRQQHPRRALALPRGVCDGCGRDRRPAHEQEPVAYAHDADAYPIGLRYTVT